MDEVAVKRGQRYATISGGLVTLDANTGETLDEVLIATGPTIGTTLASDGRVFTAGFLTGVFGFRPVAP